MFKNWKKILENRKGFSKLEKKGCSNTRNLVILFKKCAKVQSHIARQKRGARTHSARTVPKTFPHALPHAHRTCESAIIRTCAPQPNICLHTTGQKSWQFFVHILGEMMTSLIHSEIYWPLVSFQKALVWHSEALRERLILSLQNRFIEAVIKTSWIVSCKSIKKKRA